MCEYGLFCVCSWMERTLVAEERTTVIHGLHIAIKVISTQHIQGICKHRYVHPTAQQTLPAGSQSAHPVSGYIDPYARALSNVHYGHSRAAPSPRQPYVPPSYHQDYPRPGIISCHPKQGRVKKGRKKRKRHTIIKFSPAFSSPHSFAICKIPSGSGLGSSPGVSRVMMGTKTYAGRWLDKRCMTGALLQLILLIHVVASAIGWDEEDRRTRNSAYTALCAPPHRADSPSNRPAPAAVAGASWLRARCF